MRFRKIALGIAFVSALFAACSPKSAPAVPVYYVSGYGLDNIEIIANGNPTNRGKALSLFIISGTNRVQLKGDVMEGGYTFNLGKSSAFMSSDYRDIIAREEKGSGFQENRLFTFNEGPWPRWAWQDADMIESFTEGDRREIQALIKQIFEAAQKLDLEQGLSTRPWTTDPGLSAQTKAFWEKAMRGLKSYDKIVHTITDGDELTTAVGKQMVLVRTKNEEPIFYVGRDKASIPEPTPGGPPVWNYFIGPEEMFFAKFNGKWVWLMPVI